MSISQLNVDVFRAINDIGKEHASLNPIAIFMADYMIIVLALGMLVYWFTRINKNRMMVIQGGVAFVLAEVLGKIAGTMYYHNQPFAELPHVNQLIAHVVDNAFPSDHSILFFSVCFSFWLVRKKDGWLWLVFACFVGVSRIWVGVHYPGDVVTGALIGIVAALAAYWIVPKLGFVKTVLTKYEKIEQSLLPVKAKADGKSKNF
ncbi:undecaprenyl-diphosphatase [Neobacillus vireti]|uniref:Bacitracin transport permease n=1 Tax=Neobacillus vireti LMG 21834 TaxID=1131730 RepID=A0AB94IGV8_9BACI|nr:undecaprenyl-diphosphatase [Neobacillus vireti]ETI66346.1 bacitracin transport permease [Neobacillus vireti LMG 21834]KLT18367.1 bacitracin ABC transporter permease [Neobacillus vireti]